MKKILLAMLALIAAVTTVQAADTISAGVRGAVSAGRSGYSTEVFADYHVNKFVSVGATMGYTVIDYNNLSTTRRDESVPITVIAKLRLPLPVLQPYGGIGQAVILRDKHASKGSVIAVAGAEYSLMPFVFLNAEYRRQFDEKLNFLAGGVGVRF